MISLLWMNLPAFLVEPTWFFNLVFFTFMLITIVMPVTQVVGGCVMIRLYMDSLYIAPYHMLSIF